MKLCGRTVRAVGLARGKEKRERVGRNKCSASVAANSAMTFKQWTVDENSGSEREY